MRSRSARCGCRTHARGFPRDRWFPYGHPCVRCAPALRPGDFAGHPRVGTYQTTRSTCRSAPPDHVRGRLCARPASTSGAEPCGRRIGTGVRGGDSCAVDLHLDADGSAGVVPLAITQFEVCHFATPLGPTARDDQRCRGFHENTVLEIANRQGTRRQSRVDPRAAIGWFVLGAAAFGGCSDRACSHCPETGQLRIRGHLAIDADAYERSGFRLQQSLLDEMARRELAKARRVIVSRGWVMDDQGNCHRHPCSARRQPDHRSSTMRQGHPAPVQVWRSAPDGARTRLRRQGHQDLACPAHPLAPKALDCLR